MANPAPPQAEMQLNLKYQGPALDAGRMSARELGPAILSMAEMVERSSEVLYPSLPPVRVEVQGNFKRGSFDINFVAVAGKADLIGAHDLEHLATILGILGISVTSIGTGLFAVLRRRGKRVDAVQPSPGGNVTIIAAGGNVNITLNQDEYKVFSDPAVRNAVEGIVDPLKLPGIEALEIREPRRRSGLRIDKGEARYFSRSALPGESSERQVVKAWLSPRSPDFGDGNKWKFDMGGTVIYAEIADERFLAEIDRGNELFGKRDALYVDLEIEQTVMPSGVQTRYAIVKVHKHERLPHSEQPPLLPPPEEP